MFSIIKNLRDKNKLPSYIIDIILKNVSTMRLYEKQRQKFFKEYKNTATRNNIHIWEAVFIFRTNKLSEDFLLEFLDEYNVKIWETIACVFNLSTNFIKKLENKINYYNRIQKFQKKTSQLCLDDIKIILISNS